MTKKSPLLEYSLAMPEPHTHYFELEIRFSEINLPSKEKYLDFKLPVWTPGSYLIREFAKNIEAFKVTDEKGKNILSKKISKNTWRIFLGNSLSNEIKIQYRFYAFELSVRTSYLDANHAFINGANVFMYPALWMNLPSVLRIEPYQEWEKISTSLKPVDKNPFVLAVTDYDTLVDSPIEIGNQEIFEFSAEGIPHTVAFYGYKNFNKKNLSKEIQAIVKSGTEIFGENPCVDYTFIVHLLPNIYGGLEHLDSTVLHFQRELFKTPEGYKKFLSLLAHEYFHLWNVKRLRPAPLGPFDYEAENYTTLLWMAEGFTSYYEKILLLKAGIIHAPTFMQEQANRINTVENQTGSKVQSLAESSFDAWIKYYRPNENSENATVSYYIKGAVIALLLDLEIIEGSKGEKNLDDVMRTMYEEYYKKLNRGFTEEEIQKALEKAAGKSLDDFFQKYIYGTEKPDYQPYLNCVGLQIKQDKKPERAWLGANFNGRFINLVKRDSPAWQAGFHVNDELIAANNQTIEDISQWLNTQKAGTKINFTFRRNGFLQNIELVLAKDETKDYKIRHQKETSPEQEKNYEKWMRKR